MAYIFFTQFSLQLRLILQTIYVLKTEILHFLSLKSVTYKQERLQIESSLWRRAYGRHCSWLQFIVTVDFFITQFSLFSAMSELDITRCKLLKEGGLFILHLHFLQYCIVKYVSRKRFQSCMHTKADYIALISM